MVTDYEQILKDTTFILIPLLIVRADLDFLFFLITKNVIRHVSAHAGAHITCVYIIGRRVIPPKYIRRIYSLCCATRNVLIYHIQLALIKIYLFVKYPYRAQPRLQGGRPPR